MRNVAFLAAGMGLLLLQGNIFRALDGMTQWGAGAVWMVALVLDGARMIRRGTTNDSHTTTHACASECTRWSKRTPKTGSSDDSFS